MVVILLAVSLFAKNELLVDILLAPFCLISVLLLSCIDCNRCRFSSTIPNHGI